MIGIVLHAVCGSVVTIIPRRPIGCGFWHGDVILRSCRRTVGIVFDWDEFASVCVGVDVNRGVLVDVSVHIVAIIVAEFVIGACVVDVIIVIIVEINGEHTTVACVILQHSLEIGELGFSPLGIAVCSAVRFAIYRTCVERLVVCVVESRFGCCLGRLGRFLLARLGTLRAFLAVERGVRYIRRFGCGCGFCCGLGCDCWFGCWDGIRCHDDVRRILCTVAVFAPRRLCDGFCGGVFAGRVGW